MATQVANPQRHAALNSLVRTWDRRWRWKQVIYWLPRSLMPGLITGSVLAMISLMRPWMLKGDVLAVTVGMVAAGAVIMLALIWLWPRPALVSAQRFDLLFGLQERVSTALELIDGRIHTVDELAIHQLDDTWNASQDFPYRQHIPFKWPLKAWLTVGILLLAFVILMLIPNPQMEVVRQSTAQSTVIEEAGEELKELTERIAGDTTLEDTERQPLLETLETSLETLQEENITPEEAFATLSDVESSLDEQVDNIEQRLAAQQRALQEAMSALENQPPADNSDANPEGEPAAGAGDFSQRMDQMGQSLDEMSESDRQAAADSLDQAADSLEQTDPETARALREAADALRRGDVDAARDALREAAENMELSAQNQGQQSQTAQELRDAADQAQQRAQQIAQLTQDEQPPSGGDISLPEDPNQQGQNPGQQGQQGQEGQNGQDGQNPTQGQNPSDASGQNPGQQGESRPGESPSSASSPSSGDGSSGAGDASDPTGDTSGFQTGSDQIDQDNNPDGQGVGEYEPIYAPRRIGGQGENTIMLEPDSSETALREGEFAENPSGEVTVPYNQVFSDYRSAVNSALDTDYIPLGLRDVVYDYFTSLEPKRPGR